MTAASNLKPQSTRLKRQLLAVAVALAVTPSAMLLAAPPQQNAFVAGTPGMQQAESMQSRFIRQPDEALPVQVRQATVVGQTPQTGQAPVQQNAVLFPVTPKRLPFVVKPAAVTQPAVTQPAATQSAVTQSAVTQSSAAALELPRSQFVGHSQQVSKARPVRIGTSPTPVEATPVASKSNAPGSMGLPGITQPSNRIAARPTISERTQNSSSPVAMSAVVRNKQMNRQMQRSVQPVKSKPVSWLPSTTTASRQNESVRALEEAMHEYSIKAWASAEESAWECLQYAAEGIDIAGRAASFGSNRGVRAAVEDLQTAKTALREARDFSGKYGTMDTDAVARVVLSHSTTVLKGLSLKNIPATDATDRYLNEARVRLSRLAKFRPEAAQALDLIAAIYLGRGDDALLPSETALCLRRAALQGQPGNASLSTQLGMQLASLGLDVEAKWALEHAMSLEPTPQAAQMLEVVQSRASDRAAAVRMTAQMRSRLPAGFDQNRGPVPKVVQMTPRNFARVSPALNQNPGLGAMNQAAPTPAPNASTSKTANNAFSMPTTNQSPAPVGNAAASSKIQVAPVSHLSNQITNSVQADLSNPAYYSDVTEKKSSVKRIMDTVKFWK